MIPKLFCYLFLSICYICWQIPTTNSQMVSSTYGAWSNKPEFATGMKSLLDYVKDYTHTGYGPIGNSFTGSIHAAMPEFGAAPAAGGKAAGGGADGGDGGGGDDG